MDRQQLIPAITKPYMRSAINGIRNLPFYPPLAVRLHISQRWDLLQFTLQMSVPTL